MYRMSIMLFSYGLSFGDSVWVFDKYIRIREYESVIIIS